MKTALRRPPSYRLHKPTGQAVVTLNGKDFYLGKHGTPTSRECYDRKVAEWLANNRQVLPHATEHRRLTIIELIAAFWVYAESYYRNGDGTPTGELDNFRDALRPLKRLYGTLPAADFGPKALETVRADMVRADLSRSVINRQIGRIKYAFKWAVAQELVSAPVYQALCAVSGLKRGRTDARESDPVRPVPDAQVEAVRAHVSRQVWALVQLQLLTGARAGELLAMRAIDLDTSGDVWTYNLGQHKTAHHGHARTIHLGARAQAVLGPFMAGRAVDAYLFSPAEAEAERRAEQRRQRKTPVQPSQRLRGEHAQWRTGERAPAQRYTTASYRRAIARACETAFVLPDELREPRTVAARAADTPALKAQRRAARGKWRAAHVWHPHQLRHNAATAIRREFGIELARVILGHRTAAVTEIYAEVDHAKAQDVIRKIG